MNQLAMSIYRGMPRHELRVDHAMRRFIDLTKQRLALGEDPNVLVLDMKERNVPYLVMTRVLAGR